MRRMEWLLVLILLLVPRAVCAEIITHDGDTDPSTEGWKVMTGIPGVPSQEGEPNWRIICPPQTLGRWTLAEPLGDKHFEGEWAYTVRNKWNAGAPGQQRATVFDGLRAKSTALTWGPLGAYYYAPATGDTLIPDTAPDGLFHTMSVVMVPDLGDAMQFFHDGQLVATLPPEEQNDINPGTFLLYWGDGNGGPASTDIQWSYVEFGNEIVPEPATMWLALIGLLAMGVGLAWRWRR